LLVGRMAAIKALNVDLNLQLGNPIKIIFSLKDI
jgi:hypothetical protein